MNKRYDSLVIMQEKNPKAVQQGQEKLLALLAGQKTPTSEEFKQLILALDNHRVLAVVGPFES